MDGELFLTRSHAHHRRSHTNKQVLSSAGTTLLQRPDTRRRRYSQQIAQHKETRTRPQTHSSQQFIYCTRHNPAASRTASSCLSHLSYYAHIGPLQRIHQRNTLHHTRRRILRDTGASCCAISHSAIAQRHSAHAQLSAATPHIFAQCAFGNLRNVIECYTMESTQPVAAKAMYEQGASLREVSAFLGVSHITIRRWLLAQHVTLRRAGRPQLNVTSNVTRNVTVNVTSNVTSQLQDAQHALESAELDDIEATFARRNSISLKQQARWTEITGEPFHS